MQKDFEARQREEKAPLPFKIFKGVRGKFGALRLNMKRAWTNGSGRKQEGVLFLEMAPPTGNNEYDWENQKVIIALGITDVSKMLHYFRAPQNYKDDNGNYTINLFHDKGAGTKDKMKHTKNLSLSKSPDRTNFFVKLSEKNNGKVTEANVPLSPDEAITMMTLLEASVPAILSWTTDGYDMLED